MLVVIFFVLFFLLKTTTALAITIEAPQNVPSQVFAGDSFNFLTTISGVNAGEKYYVKCRVGPSSSSLTEGQTFNLSTNTWLSDNSAWTAMPVIDVGDQTTTFPVQCRPKTGSSAGSKVVYVRICLKKPDNSCGSSIQSATSATLTVVGSTTTQPLTTTQPTSAATSSPTSQPSSSSQRSSFTISYAIDQITSTDSLTVPTTLILPSSPNSKFYLKGAFKKTDNSNYFGLTQVGNAWVNNGTSYSKQFPIITDSIGYWTGNLAIKVDTEDSGFTGSGDYIFKVARYSQSGSGPTWSNEVSLQIVASTVNDDQSTTANNSPTNSPKSSTNVKGSPKSVGKFGSSIIKNQATIAGIATKTAQSSPLVKSNPPQINWWLIGGGLISLGVAIFLLVKAFRNR